MRTGRPLSEIAAELERQTKNRKDYLADQGAIEAKVVDGTVVLDGFNGKPVGVRPFAHQQLADHLGIPRKYYETMREQQPQLLTENINVWLKENAGEKRMVRVIDGEARGILSSKYRPLDNYDLASIILPKFRELSAQVTSVELTETRFYIKAILPSLSEPLPEGLAWGEGHNRVAGPDGKGRLVAALVATNSEVGAGTLKIEPSVFTSTCTNLMILTAAAMRKYHVGRSFDAAENFEIYRDETREADDIAFWLKVKDVVASAFSVDHFKAAVKQIREASKEAIVSQDLPKVVEVTVKRLALPESATGTILTHLARGGDLSKWGLSSAVTATANDFPDYEGATELERAGGKIVALAPPDWKAIANAGVAA